MTQESDAYSVEMVDDIAIIHLGSSASDRMVAETIERGWNELIQTMNPPKLVINFSGVAHASSALLGAVVGVYWQIIEHQGSLRLCGVARSIQEVFQVTRLHKRLSVDADVESAVAAIRNESLK